MKKGVMVVLALLMIVSVISLGFIGCGGEKKAPEVKEGLPAVLTVACYGTGTSAYVELAALSPDFQEITGMRLRIDPTDLRQSQVAMIREKETDFTYIHLGSMWRAVFGTEEFSTRDWGPQRIRMLFQAGPVYTCMKSKKGSPIKTVADVKGKKVAVYPGSELFWNAYLSYANLSLDDCIVVPAGGFSAATKTFLEGKAEVVHGGTTSGTWYELSASPGGLQVIPMPLEDKEAWARVMEVCPAYSPIIVPQGVGIEESWGMPIPTYYDAMYQYEDQPENIAYMVTKGLYEGYPLYKDKLDAFPRWEGKALDVLNVPIPYHAGSIRYWKEKGLWTSEHEAWQKDKLELQDNLAKAWEEALKEADSKGITVDAKNKEWLSLWDTYWKPYWKVVVK